MNKFYDPELVETSAQAYWQDNHRFDVKEDLNKEKFYCLSMLPYPSGELHMGHVRNYTIGDVIARYQNMLGKNVLQPMGWDAFGLPAENAALQHKLAPSKWTYQNISDMRTQLQRMGFAIDWKREFATCDPEYYRWEQWLFIKLYKKGLAYKKSSMVNWDPVDQTVLANEQVIDGKGWRSGAEVERREIQQWFLRITDYADELLEDLDKLEGWPEQVRTMQRNWIGRSHGVDITFSIKDLEDKLKVYTTRPDTLLGATYLAIAAEHPLSQHVAKTNPEIAGFIEKCRHIKVSEAEMATMAKEGHDLGLKALHPITGDELSVYVANYVLMEYGSGAVMAVPAHDERDHEFATQYQLPIRPVIQPENGEDWDYSKSAYIGDGTLINSNQFDGMTTDHGFQAIAQELKSSGRGVLKTQYRLRDWGVSRQRYWGAPIPMIYCSECGEQPVPEQDLPVRLPEDIVLENPGSPLNDLPEFYKVPCPCCGQEARRETDTFDTFMESSWYYTRYCCFDQDKSMLDTRANYWAPVDQYVGGVEHAIMHLLYARFIHKVLRDQGLVNSDEPFKRLLTQGMVLKDGAKMSKSKGNTVSPMELIAQYGADTVRLFSIFAAPPEQSLEWSDSGVEGSARFLKKLWQITADFQTQKRETTVDFASADDDIKAIHKGIHENLSKATFDMERLQFNTVVSAGMKILNLIQPLDCKNDHHQALIREALNILLRMLAPITPHISHHLWRALEFGDDITTAAWPKVDHKALKASMVDLVLQVNGKKRGDIKVSHDASQETIEQTALNHEKVQNLIQESGQYKKIIIVPNKLVNIVI